MGESVTDDEVNSKLIKNRDLIYINIAMIKIAGVKSNDKINFKEFVDFFNKVDWCECDSSRRTRKYILKIKRK